MLELALIVIFIFGVLEIILFFKIWGMTNNVAKIREILESQNEKHNNNPQKVQQLAQTGHKAEAEETLEDIARKLSYDIMNKKISAKVAEERFAKLEEQYKSLNKTMPDYIAAVKDML